MIRHVEPRSNLEPVVIVLYDYDVIMMSGTRLVARHPRISHY